MLIAFHSNQIGLRGTEVSLFDYAHFSEQLLGHRSLIVAPRQSPLHHPYAIKHFSERFQVLFYDSLEELERSLDAHGAECFYCQKAGSFDGIVSRGRKTVVHAVFKHFEPHGDVYAYISEWLSNEMTGGASPFVPYMVDLPDDDQNFRAQLNIPPEAVVFGRYGGMETFDLPFVHRAVYETAAANPKIYFLFLNTAPFCPPLPNVIHANGTPSKLSKVRFINTCDAMLHSRRQGESFGLAVAEFSSKNRPVLTWTGSEERAHIAMLGEKGLYFDDEAQLRCLLTGFRPESDGSWDCYTSRFSPAMVMESFRSVFLR